MQSKPISEADFLKTIKALAFTSLSAKSRMRHRESPQEVIHRLSSALHLIGQYCNEWENKYKQP